MIDKRFGLTYTLQKIKISFTDDFCPIITILSKVENWKIMIGVYDISQSIAKTIQKGSPVI